MPPLSGLDHRVVHTLESTRSVRATAEALALSQAEVKRQAMMAYGLGRLECKLMDF